MNPLAWQYRELVEGLHALQPKKRGNPVSWIVLAGCAFVIGGLGVDASVREAIFSPAGAHRAPSFTVATLPSLPASLPASVVAPNTRVAMPVINVPSPQAIPALAPDTAAAAPTDDGPLPHANAKNGPKTTRAHSGKHARK